MSFNEGGTDFLSILFFVYYIQKDTEIFVLCYIFTNKTQMDIMKTTYENDSIYKMQIRSKKQMRNDDYVN